MNHQLWRSVVAVLFVCLPFPAAAAERTPLVPADVYRLDVPTDVALSPDGAQAMYVRRWSDAETRTERYALWRGGETDAERQPLEADQPDARKPLWSPDGRWIAFLSTRPLSDGAAAVPAVPAWSDPAVDIWLLPAAGGTAIPLTVRPKPYGRVFNDGFYGRLAFSPDSRRLVFVADDGADPRTEAEKANNVRVVRPDQGEGYEGYGPAQIWIAELASEPGEAAAGKITRVTHDEVWYGDPQWRPDGRALLVVANRTDDRESVRFCINKNFDVYQITMDGRMAGVTAGPGPEVCPRYSPDGRRVLCLSVPRKGSHFDVFNLLVLDLAVPGIPVRTLFNQHAPFEGSPPHLSPLWPLPANCWLDAERVYYPAARGTETVRQVVSLASEDATATTDDDTLTARDEAKKRLVPPANAFLDERLAATTQVVRWKSFDGLEIEGVLTLPPAEVSQPPHKLIAFPHGGPHSRSTTDFNFTAQVFAGAGYAVFAPNFRGSGGYGQKFIDADRADFGGGDMRDILTGVDHLISQGVVDERRQFVYGVSYGGYMTSWLVTQTDRFRAAAPQNAVTDLSTMWHLSDIQSWTEWEFGGLPWEVPDALRARSPLTYASRVTTPTLILHAANDRRCPLAMGQMFYRALERSGVETEMVIYPDERHPIQQLPHHEDVLTRVLEWFAKHDL